MRLPPSVRRALGLLVFGLVGVDASSAFAQSGGYGQPVLDPQKKAEAKGHFDRGADLYAQGSYEEALAEWGKAYDISQHPLIFESVANAYERLGKPREAKEALLKWRAAAPPEEHAVLDRRLENLEARAKKMDEDEAAAKAAAAQNAAKAEGAAADDEEGGLLGPLGIAGVVVGAIGVSAVGGGIVVGIVASGKRPDEAEVCRAGDGGSLCLDTAKGDIDSSSTLALVSDIMWIGGAVATAAGGTMLILDLTGALEEEEPEAAATDARRTPAPRARAQLAPVAGPAGAGLTLRGTW